MPWLTCYLFKGLSKSQLQRIANISMEKQFQKGQLLFHEGRKADQLFLLKEGKVELLTKIGEAIELPIDILRSKGSCFGTTILVAPYLYSLSSRCAEDSSLIVIKKTDLEQVISQDCELGFIMMSNMSQHLLERLKETREELKIHFRTFVKSVHA